MLDSWNPDLLVHLVELRCWSQVPGCMGILKTVDVGHCDLVLVALELGIPEVKVSPCLEWVCSTLLVKSVAEMKSTALEVNLEEDVVDLEPQ